jgi:hypothetical protein
MKPLISALILTGFALASSSLKAQPKPQPTPKQSSAPETVRTVEFCDIVKQPRQFFGQTIRIKAIWQQGHEFSYLTDESCPPKFRYEIAVRVGDAQDAATTTNLAKFREREYGGRAMITAVGALLKPGKYYGYFRYQFYIYGLEDVQHVIAPYEGTVEAGRTYRAVVRGDKELELVLSPRMRIEFHYAYRIEWINLSEFPELKELHKTSGERTIVFSVIASERKQIEERRWNRSLQMKIVRVE